MALKQLVQIRRTASDALLRKYRILHEKLLHFFLKIIKYTKEGGNLVIPSTAHKSKTVQKDVII